MTGWQFWLLTGAVFSLGAGTTHRFLMWSCWVVALINWAETVGRTPIN